MAVVARTNASVTLNSDANYRSFISAIHTFLTDCGFTKSTETGEVNTATVTLPSSGAALVDWSVWQFTDAQQGSYPLYFKLWFGQRSNIPNFGLTVGEGSNGSGTLTNSQSGGTAGDRYPSTNSDIFLIGSAAEARLAIVQNHSAGTLIVIERTRDNDGTPNGAGVFVYEGTPAFAGTGMCGVYCPGHSSYRTRFMQSGGGKLPVNMPPNNQSLAVDSDQGYVPIFPAMHVPKNPLMGLLGKWSGEGTDLATFTLPWYGGTRTFKICNAAVNQYAAQGMTQQALALLWENA